MNIEMFGWLVVASSLSGHSQDWSCFSFDSYSSPVLNVNGKVTLPIPIVQDPHYIASILTTTNDPSILGDLTGMGIVVTLQLDTSDNPLLFFLADCTHGTGYSFVRPYFTTTSTRYYLRDVNANSTNYWWADYAYAQLSTSNYGYALPGTYTLTAPLIPSQWSDSLGHYASDTNYTAAFYYAVSHTAQIGLSFGGGCYFDVGIGVVATNGGSATLTIIDYSAVSYIPTLNQDLSIHGLPGWPYQLQHSDDLQTWTDTAITNIPGFYRARMAL